LLETLSDPMLLVMEGVSVRIRNEVLRAQIDSRFGDAMVPTAESAKEVRPVVIYLILY
jgi:hypothetical protein